jgi:hypothetical protein
VAEKDPAVDTGPAANTLGRVQRKAARRRIAAAAAVAGHTAAAHTAAARNCTENWIGDKGCRIGRPRKGSEMATQDKIAGRVRAPAQRRVQERQRPLQKQRLSMISALWISGADEPGVSCFLTVRSVAGPDRPNAAANCASHSRQSELGHSQTSAGDRHTEPPIPAGWNGLFNWTRFEGRSFGF